MQSIQRAYHARGGKHPRTPARTADPVSASGPRTCAYEGLVETSSNEHTRGLGRYVDRPPGASLSGEVNSVPWLPLRQLFDGFADIRGVGMSKMTKALYPKRPALIPMLDSIVQTYLRDDDLEAQAPFAERALALVRGYQRDLDRNRAAVQAVRQDLTMRGYRLTEVRILDLLILSAQAAA